MKLLSAAILLLASFLTTSLSFAFPALHDAVKFTGTRVVNGVSTEYSYLANITQEHSTKNKFFVHAEATIGGQTQVSEDWLDRENLMTPGEIADHLSNCEKYNQGVHESITTAGKTFDTCHKIIPGEESLYELWIGQVPFGAVRFRETSKADGAVIDALLQSYTEGN